MNSTQTCSDCPRLQKTIKKLQNENQELQNKHKILNDAFEKLKPKLVECFQTTNSDARVVIENAIISGLRLGTPLAERSISYPSGDSWALASLLSATTYFVTGEHVASLMSPITGMALTKLVCDRVNASFETAQSCQKRAAYVGLFLGVLTDTLSILSIWRAYAYIGLSIYTGSLLFIAVLLAYKYCYQPYINYLLAGAGLTQ